MSTAVVLQSGWRLVRFGDVVSNVNENTRDPASLGLDRVVGLDHLDPESLPLRRWDHLADLPDGTSFTRIFRSGQILFGKRRAYQRKVAVPDFDGICSGDILVFEPFGSEVLPEFLPFLVQSDGFFDHALGTSAGSLSPRTKWQELAKYEFALPPAEEQERIAHAMSAFDDVSTAYQSAVGRLASTRGAVFRNLIQGDGATKSIAWGRCREDATVHRLGDLCTVARGASPRPKGNPDYFASNRTDHHWIMISDLSRSRVGKYLTDTAEFLTPAGVEKSRLVRPGSLLLTNCATVGVPIFSGIDGCIHDGFLVFDDVDRSISDQYLYRLFEFLTPWFRSIAQTGTQANLNTGILKELEVPVLSVDAQRQLIDTLDAVDSTAVLAEANLRSIHQARSAVLSACLGGRS